MVDIAGERDAFMMAEEFGLQDSNFHEGQSLMVQVSQEARAEKGAKLVRSIQLVGDYVVYCPYRMDVTASSRIEDIVFSHIFFTVQNAMTGVPSVIRDSVPCFISPAAYASL